MSDPVVLNGQVYPDELTATAATHPNIPPELKRVYITGQEEPTGDTSSRMPLESPRKPTDALLSDPGTPVPPSDTASPEPPNELVPEMDQPSVIGKVTKGLIGQFYNQVKDALTLPGDVYQGNVQPGSPQEMERVNNLAGLMVFGPAPVARQMAEGTLGSFMGVGARSFDREALQRAHTLEADGVNPEEIWGQTGTFRGADGRWRQEIPDQNVNILSKGTVDVPGSPDKDWTQIGGSNLIGVKPSGFGAIPMDASIEDMMKFLTQPKQDIRLKDVLDHPELYDAYPELQNVKISPMPAGLPYYGMARGNEIFMNNLPPEQFTSTLLHEVQHLIQGREGFASGANSNMFLSENLRNARSQFLRVKQEVESKIAQETSPEGLDSLKRLIFREQNGLVDKEHIPYLNDLKNNHPEVYRQLTNLRKGEDLLNKAEDEAHKRYQNIMGEVESRNVQARMDMSNLDRLFNSPMRTEGQISPRSQQIDPRYITNHIIGK